MINEPCLYSHKTSSGAVVAAPALFWGLILSPAAAASTVIVYDNASAASGTIVGEGVAVANGASVVFTLNAPVMCLNGIYCAITGSSAVAGVYYNRSG